MRILVWDKNLQRMIGILKLHKMPFKKELRSGDKIDHYILQIYKGQPYPRFHFEQREARNHNILFDVHIDWSEHNGQSQHRMLDNLRERIKGIEK